MYQVVRGWFRVVMVFALLFAPGRDCPAEGAEEYQYISRSRGSDGVAEHGEVEVRDGMQGFQYRSVTRLDDGRQRVVELRAGPAGAVEYANEEVSGEVHSRVEIRRAGPRLTYRRLAGKAEEFKTLDIPPGRVPCAGPSLLAVTRHFPFDSGGMREVFFVDFDGHRISGTLRQVGEERIEVPAGAFDCYHLELTLRVFLFRPRVHFWVSRQGPHMLVRQVGKRSALGPVFVTELQAVR